MVMAGQAVAGARLTGETRYLNQHRTTEVEQ
jgi:hypothetical protein